MKTIKIAAAFLLMIAVTTGIKAQTEQKEQLTVPLSEPGKPFKLNVGLVNGSIKVVSYEGKDIVIDVQSGSTTDKKARKAGRDGGVNVNVNVNTNVNNEKNNSGGMKRINAGNNFDVSAEEKNNRVTVHSDSWKGAITLTIKVPQSEAGLKLHTVNDGDIDVTNVNGELEISNTNGAIHLTNVSGSVVANTVNGSVVATFKSIDTKAAMAFSTLNGNVDVTFPATFKGNVKLKTDMGEMYTDFDIETDRSQAKVNRTNQGGMYRVSTDNWIYGKINGGGPEIMMKNMTGNIYIRKAK